MKSAHFCRLRAGKPDPGQSGIGLYSTISVKAAVQAAIDQEQIGILIQGAVNNDRSAIQLNGWRHGAQIVG
jgi:hypothetical protein